MGQGINNTSDYGYNILQKVIDFRVYHPTTKCNFLYDSD